MSKPELPSLRIACISLYRRPDRQFVFERTFPGFWDLPVEFFPAIDGRMLPAAKIQQKRIKHGVPQIEASTWALRQTERLLFRDFLRSGEDFLLFMEDDCLLLPGFAEDMELFLSELPLDADVAFLGGRFTQAIETEAEPEYGVQPCPPAVLNHCLLYTRKGAAKVARILAHPTADTDVEIANAVQKGELSAWWAGRFTAVQRTSQSDIVGDHGGLRYGRAELPDFGLRGTQDDLWLLLACVTPGATVIEWGSGGSTCHIAHQLAGTGNFHCYEHRPGQFAATCGQLEAAGLQVQVEMVLVKPFQELPEDEEKAAFLPGILRDYVTAPLGTFSDGEVDMAFINGADRMRCAQVALKLLRPGGLLLIKDFWETEAYRVRIGELLSQAEYLCATPSKVSSLGEPQPAGLALFQKREAVGSVSELGPQPSLTVITLWRPGWSEAQQRVLAWLQREDWAESTKFIWTVAAGSSTTEILGQAVGGFPQDRGLEFEIQEIPGAPPDNVKQKHVLVAAAYTELFGRCKTEQILLVEDDNIPPPGGLNLIQKRFHEAPDGTAAVMGAYRSRQKCDAVCAQQSGKYIPWALLDQKTKLLPAIWVGGGFTLYDTSSLQACLPLVPIFHNGKIKQGWDVVLSTSLSAAGKFLFVDPTLRVEHACPEVVAWCRDNGESMI